MTTSAPRKRRPARLTVVVCCFDGAPVLGGCLASLMCQTIADDLQIVVVDDGSTDETFALAQEYDVEIVRHETNRGLAAARNTALEVATAPIVAFLDDDCEAYPDWAESLGDAFDAMPDAVGIGGPVLPIDDGSFHDGYLARNNPLAPLEIDLARGSGAPYRLWRHVVRQLQPPPEGARPLYSLVGANMAFRTSALRALQGFDERFRFGAEELDLCIRLNDRYPVGALSHAPEAVVHHRFDPSWRDVFRRRLAYGIGNGRLFCKHPGILPAIYPAPLLLAAAFWVSRRRRGRLALSALALPQLLLPRGPLQAARSHTADPLADGYLHVVEEASTTIGFLRGVWRYREMWVSRRTGRPDRPRRPQAPYTRRSRQSSL